MTVHFAVVELLVSVAAGSLDTALQLTDEGNSNEVLESGPSYPPIYVETEEEKEDKALACLV